MRILCAAFDAMLIYEASVRLDYLLCGHARCSFQSVDILREAGVQQPFLGKKAYKRMRRRRSKFSRCEFVGENVDYKGQQCEKEHKEMKEMYTRTRVSPEEANVKNRFGVGQF